MSKINKKTAKYNKVFPFLLLFATLLMGIGYAAVNSITADILGTSTALANDGVFISFVDLIDYSNVSIENCNINLSSKTTLATSIELENNENSSCTFEVTIRNNTTDRYIYTGAIHDEEFYVDQNDQYNEDITYEITGINNDFILDVGQSIEIQVKFKFLTSDTSQNILNSYINFSFKKLHFVTYQNIDGNYRTYAIDGENFIVDFSDKDYESLNITMNGNVVDNYTYENKILTIPNVNGNIVISYDNGGGSDTPSSGIPEGKDFEVEIMQQGGIHYYIFSLTNITDTDSTGWAVYIEVPSDARITNSYNCVPTKEEGSNILVITNASWNGVIKAGEKQYNIFGITFESADEDFRPTNFTGLLN